MTQRALEDAIHKALNRWTGCDWRQSFSWSTELPDCSAKVEGEVTSEGLFGDEDVNALINCYLPSRPTEKIPFFELSRADQHTLKLAIQEATVCSVSFAKKCQKDAERANEYGREALRALKQSELAKVHKFLHRASQLELGYGDNPVWDEPTRIAAALCEKVALNN